MSNIRKRIEATVQDRRIVYLELVGMIRNIDKKCTHLTTPLTSFNMTFLFTETQISSNTNGRDRDGSRAHGKVKAV